MPNPNSIQISLTLICVAGFPACESSQRARSSPPVSTASIAVSPVPSSDTATQIAESDAPKVVDSLTVAGYTVVLKTKRDEVSHAVTLIVQLVPTDKGKPAMQVVSLSDIDIEHRLIRADTNEIVIGREGTYGPIELMKLFLDPVTKVMLKRVTFSPTAGLDVFSSRQAAAALKLPEDLIRALKEREPTPKPGEPWDTVLLPQLKSHPMPEPTYAEFARARPHRVEDGYDSASAAIEEIPGPVQVVGNRIWIGKRFYDGEGTTGIGGVGYFDTTASKYTFLSIPEVVGWSVSALLVDDTTLWIGLVEHPEGADYPLVGCCATISSPEPRKSSPSTR